MVHEKWAQPSLATSAPAHPWPSTLNHLESRFKIYSLYVSPRVIRWAFRTQRKQLQGCYLIFDYLTIWNRIVLRTCMHNLWLHGRTVEKMFWEYKYLFETIWIRNNEKCYLLCLYLRNNQNYCFKTRKPVHGWDLGFVVLLIIRSNQNDSEINVNDFVIASCIIKTASSSSSWDLHPSHRGGYPQLKSMFGRFLFNGCRLGAAASRAGCRLIATTWSTNWLEASLAGRRLNHDAYSNDLMRPCIVAPMGRPSARGWTPPSCQNAVRLSTLTSCQDDQEEKCFLPKHIFSSQQTKTLT